MTHPRIEKTAFLALFLAAVPALAAQAPAWVESEVKAAESDLTALRHKLHAMPELGNQEVKTQAEIVRILKEAGIVDIRQEGTANYYYLTLRESNRRLMELGYRLEEFIY